MVSGGKGALDQVATGWRFPVDHLARDEDAGKLIDHEAVVEFAPPHAAGRRDRFRQGTGSKKFEGTRFDRSGENLGRIPRSKMGEMPEQGGGRGIQIQSPPSFAHVVGRDPAQLFFDLLKAEGGFQIEGDRDRGNLAGAENRAEVIEWSTLQSVAGDHELAMAAHPTGRERDVLQGVSFHLLEQLGGPLEFPTTVCGLQGGDLNPEFPQDAHPMSGGSCRGPGSASEGKDHCVGLGHHFLPWRAKEKAMGFPGLQTKQFMIDRGGHAQFAVALDPCPQQRCGLHRGGEDLSTRGRLGLDSQSGGPGSQSHVVAGMEDRTQEIPTKFRALIALYKWFEGFIVGQVEPALARDQQLAADRSLGVVESNLSSTCSRNFRRAESRGTSAHDRNLRWTYGIQERKVQTYWQIPSATAMEKPELAGTSKNVPAR